MRDIFISADSSEDDALEHARAKAEEVRKLALSGRDFATLARQYSEGPGADYVKSEALRRDLGNLKVLPFQPMDVYPDVLGTADVLVSMLELGAGRYSVPSKVLTYLCAGRAILAALPLDNLASRIVARAGAGLVAAPGDLAGFLAAAESLLDQPARRAAAGAAARAYAERAFDIAAIAARFDAVLAAAAHRATSR